MVAQVRDQVIGQFVRLHPSQSTEGWIGLSVCVDVIAPTRSIKVRTSTPKQSSSVAVHLIVLRFGVSYHLDGKAGTDGCVGSGPIKVGGLFLRAARITAIIRQLVVRNVLIGMALRCGRHDCASAGLSGNLRVD